MGRFIKVLKRIALDGYLTPVVAEKLINAEAQDWEEGQHPRDESGKFTSGGGGGGGGSSGLPSKEEIARMEKEYWQKRGDTINENTKSDLNFAINMMRGSETAEEKGLEKDLKYVSEAKSRSDFVKRGEEVKKKWDAIRSRYPEEPSAAEGPSWHNPYEEFKNCLEREKSDKNSYEKALGTSGSSGRIDFPKTHAEVQQTAKADIAKMYPGAENVEFDRTNKYVKFTNPKDNRQYQFKIDRSSRLAQENKGLRLEFVGAAPIKGR